MNTLVLFAVQYPSVPGVLLITAIVLIRMMRVPEDRKRCEWCFVATMLAIPAAVLCELFTIWLSHFVPYKLDQYVFQVDAFFGAPSFMIGRIVLAHLWMKIAISVSYGCLNVAMLAILMAYLWLRTEEETLRLVRTFILNLFVAIPIYMLIPVCGPGFAFVSFPVMPHHLAPHAIAINAPPNGIPSVHTSTALLILWFARRWKIGAIAASLYLVLIVISTLGSGQHYFVDLLAAVPYTALIVRLGRMPWRVHSTATEVAKETAEAMA
jgi:hypothetical protein